MRRRRRPSYYSSNPSISFTVSPSEYSDLNDEAKNLGKSLAGLIRHKIAIADSKSHDLPEESVNSYKLGFKRGFLAGKAEQQINERRVFNKGYVLGFQAGKNKLPADIKNKLPPNIMEYFVELVKERVHKARITFEITYPCSVCGQPITMLPGHSDHIAMQKLMFLNGWRHPDC